MLDQVAKALLNKGMTLSELDLGNDEIAAYDEVARRFGDASEPTIMETVAEALINKGLTVGVRDHREEAIAIFDKLINRLDAATEPALRYKLAEAMNGRGYEQLILAKKKWNDRSARQSLLEQSLMSLKGALKDTSDRALVLGNIGYASFLLGIFADADKALREALTLGGASLRDDELADSQIATVPEDDKFQKLINDLWAELGVAIA